MKVERRSRRRKPSRSDSLHCAQDLPYLFLFVAERFNRVQAGSFPCRPEAEDEADADAGDEAADGSPERNV